MNVDVTANYIDISVTHVSRYAVRACQSQVLSNGVFTELGCFGSVARMFRVGVSQAKILFLK